MSNELYRIVLGDNKNGYKIKKRAGAFDENREKKGRAKNSYYRTIIK